MKNAQEVLREAGNNHHTGLYNNSVELWKAAREVYKERGTFLVIVEGHICAGADGLVARFKDDNDAAATLEAAGYKRDGVTQNLIYHP